MSTAKPWEDGVNSDVDIKTVKHTAQKVLLLFQRTRIWFPAPMFGGTLRPVTLALGDMIDVLILRLWTLHSNAHSHMHTRQIHTIKNKSYCVYECLKQVKGEQIITEKSFAGEWH